MVTARIEPIGTTGKKLVTQATKNYIYTAEKIFKSNFPLIAIRFDLMGKTAGMYKVRNAERSIRYNPYLFSKYFDDNLATTIPHEVAHYVTDILFGLNNIKPHGSEWRAVMQDFGVKPQVTGRYDLTGIPVRQQRRFDYQCNCTCTRLSGRQWRYR